MRLETVTRAQRDEGHKALAPFFTAGYPDEAVFLDLIRAAADVGCRVVEIGIPFSDPVVMSYLNPVMRMGLDVFAAAAADAGVGGVILPDVPVEEAYEARAALAARDLDLVSLMAPTTSAERAQEIAGTSSGFLYLVSLTGVTGADLDVEATVPSLVARARAVTDLPAYVGFGVSTAEQARDAVASADGVIIGSALVRIIDSAGADSAGAVHAYLGGVAGGMK